MTEKSPLSRKQRVEVCKEISDLLIEIKSTSQKQWDGIRYASEDLAIARNHLRAICKAKEEVKG